MQQELAEREVQDNRGSRYKSVVVLGLVQLGGKGGLSHIPLGPRHCEPIDAITMSFSQRLPSVTQPAGGSGKFEV